MCPPHSQVRGSWEGEGGGLNGEDALTIWVRGWRGSHNMRASSGATAQTVWLDWEGQL